MNLCVQWCDECSYEWRQTREEQQCPTCSGSIRYNLTHVLVKGETWKGWQPVKLEFSPAPRRVDL